MLHILNLQINKLLPSPGLPRSCSTRGVGSGYPTSLPDKEPAALRCTAQSSSNHKHTPPGSASDLATRGKQTNARNQRKRPSLNGSVSLLSRRLMMTLELCSDSKTTNACGCEGTLNPVAIELPVIPPASVSALAGSTTDVGGAIRSDVKVHHVCCGR